MSFIVLFENFQWISESSGWQSGRLVCDSLHGRARKSPTESTPGGPVVAAAHTCNTHIHTLLTFNAQNNIAWPSATELYGNSHTPQHFWKRSFAWLYDWLSAYKPRPRTPSLSLVSNRSTSRQHSAVLVLSSARDPNNIEFFSIGIHKHTASIILCRTCHYVLHHNKIFVPTSEWYHIL